MKIEELVDWNKIQEFRRRSEGSLEKLYFEDMRWMKEERVLRRGVRVERMDEVVKKGIFGMWAARKRILAGKG